jgi:hypothetical protein
MKNITKLFLYLNICLTLLACSKISPKGEIEVKDVTVENFTKLNLKGDFKVFFAKGNQNLVSVETYPNVYKNLDIEVENGILTIEENRKPENVDFYSIRIRFYTYQILISFRKKHFEISFKIQFSEIFYGYIFHFYFPFWRNFRASQKSKANIKVKEKFCDIFHFLHCVSTE